MINIFIPNKIGLYYIFPQTIVGIITKSNNIHAVKSTFKAREISIDQAEVFPISEGLNGALSHLGKFNKIRLGLSNQDVIFKEITLPFLDPNKIKMVLPFELESSLPFPIANSFIDFVITRQDKDKKSSSVIAVVTKKSEVNAILGDIVNKKYLADCVVTVNAISIYNLYKKLGYKLSSLLLEISTNSISISYINQQQQLKLIRTIPRGIGLQNDPESEKEIKWLTDEILFSVNSFKTQLLEFDEPEKIIIVWNRPYINELDSFIYKNTDIKTEHFPISKLSEIKGLSGSVKLKQEDVIAFATIYTTEDNDNFNLNQQTDILTTKQFIYKIAPSVSLISLLLLSLIITRQVKVRSLENQIELSKQQVLGRLKQTFSITDKKAQKSLNNAVKAAEKIVSNEEDLWFSFSKKVRFSYLRYLEELSKILNKKELGLSINKLSISEGIINIQGEVPSYPQLEEFEKALEESNLFSHITRPEQLKFTIKITLKKNNEDEQ